MTATWRPVRPFRHFPDVNPENFDPRKNSFIPDRSIADQHIATVSPQKVRLIGAKIYRSSTQSINNAAFEAITWNAESFDTSDFWTSGSKIVIPYDGIYDISCYAEFEADAVGDRRGKLQKNGSGVGTFATAAIGGGSPSQTAFATTLKLAEADELEWQVFQNSGSGKVVNAGESNNFFAITYLGTV